MFKEELRFNIITAHQAPLFFELRIEIVSEILFLFNKTRTTI